MKWDVIHEMDEDNGTPTGWGTEVNSSIYGRFVWICLLHDGSYEISSSERTCLKITASLASAKRWVAINVK